MANLATQNITRTGLAPALAPAAAGGDTCTPSSDTFLWVQNLGGSPITVTIATPATVAGLAVADVAVSVVNGGGNDKFIGPLPAQFFADPTDGLCSITYSSVTSVTVGAFKVTQG